MGKRADKYNKSKVWYKRRYNLADIATKAYQGVVALRGLVNAELHTSPIASSAAISTTGTVIPLVVLAQGDNDGNRTGNSILTKSLYGKMYIIRNNSATFTNARILIVRDTQQIADTTPAITDILVSVDTLAQRNVLTQGRFKVLMDRFISLDANFLQKHWKVGKKLDQHVRFNGINTTDIQKGGLYLVMFSDQVTNTPTVYYNLNLRYYDN